MSHRICPSKSLVSQFELRSRIAVGGALLAFWASGHFVLVRRHPVPACAQDSFDLARYHRPFLLCL